MRQDQGPARYRSQATAGPQTEGTYMTNKTAQEIPDPQYLHHARLRAAFLTETGRWLLAANAWRAAREDVGDREVTGMGDEHEFAFFLYHSGGLDELSPKVGDIVTYKDDGYEDPSVTYLVVGLLTEGVMAGGISIYPLGKCRNRTVTMMTPESVTVIRRASYVEVQS